MKYTLKIHFTSGVTKSFLCSCSNRKLEDVWAYLHDQFSKSEWVAIKDLVSDCMVNIRADKVCCFELSEAVVKE